MATVKIPEGWSLERDGYGKGYDVLSTPPPIRYSATIDWERRAFRSGMSVTGTVASVKKYAGRGWRQALVDDAVTHLRKVL
jgi:hypothetical protein